MQTRPNMMRMVPCFMVGSSTMRHANVKPLCPHNACLADEHHDKRVSTTAEQHLNRADETNMQCVLHVGIHRKPTLISGNREYRWNNMAQDTR